MEKSECTVIVCVCVPSACVLRRSYLFICFFISGVLLLYSSSNGIFVEFFCGKMWGKGEKSCRTKHFLSKMMKSMLGGDTNEEFD